MKRTPKNFQIDVHGVRTGPSSSRSAWCQVNTGKLAVEDMEDMTSGEATHRAILSAFKAVPRHSNVEIRLHTIRIIRQYCKPDGIRGRFLGMLVRVIRHVASRRGLHVTITQISRCENLAVALLQQRRIKEGQNGLRRSQSEASHPSSINTRPADRNDREESAAAIAPTPSL